jgi:hypothetical protein
MHKVLFAGAGVTSGCIYLAVDAWEEFMVCVNFGGGLVAGAGAKKRCGAIFSSLSTTHAALW